MYDTAGSIINSLWREYPSHTARLADSIWEKETKGKVFDTPESRCRLERRMGEICRVNNPI
jgi:hypothetical protein